MSIRVYEYGLLPPHTNAELVDQQMVKAHRYRNLLVEIERERRQRVSAAMGAHPDLATIQVELSSLIAERDKLREGISAQRRQTRSRSESPDQRKAVRDIGTQIKQLRERVKDARKAVAQDSTVKDAMEAAEVYSKERVKAARAACGVYWGTYLLQEQAADQARKERTPPKFVRWQGEGRVSVQIQKGIPLCELWGDDTQVQIQPVNPAAWDMATRRGVRRRLSRTVLRLRVGSEGAGNRIPIWAEWQMVMHRPIPQGGVIKLATVSRRRRDCVSWEWRVQLTVDVSACESRRVVPSSGAVALNLGFCQRQDGEIRSGYMVGDDGMEREILVSKSDDVRTSRGDRGHVMVVDATSPAAPGPSSNATSPADLSGPDDPQKPSHAEHGRMSNVHGQSKSWPSPATSPGPQRDGTGPAVPGHLDQEPESSPAAPGRPQRASNWIINGLSKADSIRSFRDKALNAMKAILCAWRAGETIDAEPVSALIAEWEWAKTKSNPADAGASRISPSPADAETERATQTVSFAINPQVFPEWFVKGTEVIHAWRSADRFRRLAYEWAEQRFEGDHIFPLIWAWRERDEHLERYESGLRRSALRDRREAYRILAAQMAERYRYLLVDDTDLTKFQQSPTVESGKVEIPIVKHNQRIAAGSLLRGAMINAFGPDRVIKMSHKDMTRRCNACGVINEWDRVAADRFHTCDRCGARWDQDANNGRNLLAEYRRSLASGDEIETAEPKKPSRSERFKRARANRAA